MSSPPDHSLEIMLLGGFDACLNGHSIAGNCYNKMRALLAYLAVEREQDHSREALAELLWGDNDPVTARGNLRRTLADLRRVLELPSGISLFSSSKHTLRFAPNAYVDVLDFAGRMPVSPGGATDYDEQRIVALYRGEFLAGLFLPDCPDFEDWLQIQRENLHRRALALLELLSDRCAQWGDYSKALHFDLRYIELEPWDENAHRRAMLLYALNGQTSAALGQYEICCRLLKNELGALPGEETRQLLERIRSSEFRRELRTPAEASTLQAIPILSAERRQVTVLYCELNLAAIDDPDEAMELLSGPQACCVDIIRQFSGHIVQTHGGGLLAYFGYPQADEHAARRAVQAALAVIRVAAHSIEIRAAVHTGLIITSGDTAMPDAAGRTSKLAIQCRQSVGYGEVAISQQTHDIVAGYFNCISLGAQSIPDIAQSLEIFKVVQESGARTRLDAAALLTPLVGRQDEIATLMAFWEQAAQGVRRVVLIQGEAGLGKSRLLHAIKQRLADRPHTIRELRCFPEFSQSPFHPLIAMFEAVIGSDHDDTPEIKFGKVVAYVETHYPEAMHDAVPMLTQLLSLDLDDQPPSDLSPQKQKELTCAILLSTLEALSLKQPVLLVVEDMHWIDSSTLEFLTLLVEKQSGGAIFPAFTARPEFVPPWPEELALRLAIAPLSEAAVTEMIASISGDIPPETVRLIVDRADGVPLFVEEMAKLASLDNQGCIPATLHDLLAARMDMLGEAKLAAQLASTVGREFDLALLHKIYPSSPEALSQALDALQDAGLILKVNKATRQFKHALIQEAAYQSQTKAARQVAHQRIAHILHSDFPDVVTTQPELLAQHLASGGETRPSIEYWIKAGQRAAQNSANTEAIEHFNNGLQGLMTLPPDKERDSLEFTLRINLGTTLSTTKGYGSVEADAAYTRAMELAEDLGDSACLYQALWGMWLSSSSRIGHVNALELAEKLLRLAEQNNEPLQLQQALYAMGNSLLWTGQLEKARLHQERSMALYQSSHHETMVSEFGENICVSCGSQLAWVLWLLGFSNQALAISEQTLALAYQVNHPYSLCYAKAHSLALGRWMRQAETTCQLAEKTMMLSNQHGFPVWLLSGTAFHGWALSMQGQLTGISQIRQVVSIVRAAMSGIEAYFLGMLGEAYMYSGQLEESLSVMHQTLDVINAKDDRFLESEIYRLKGECLLALSPANTEEAEACFDQALVISRKQQAKSLELRAAISMARLWQQQGKQEDGRRLLEDVYDWFTEGFDTPDLQEAANLIQCE
ncbi:MAG: BTAD domain-containing putative transcriptional regulator [Methylobacter sp.]|nr:BTAD domain-containing putative transcriptional regulator [Methylobacter sp.]